MENQDLQTVSAIIPLYNKGKYIERAISSVLAQTYPPCEIVVVDDGSTDGGPDNVLKFNDPKITLIRQENRGPGPARNTGLARARGKYVAFLDADDEWYPSFLESCISCVNDDRDGIALVSTGYYSYPSMKMNGDGMGNLRGVYEVAPETDLHLIRQVETFIHLCFSVMRTDTARRLGGYFDKFKCMRGEDTHFLLKLLFNEKVCIIPEPLGLYHTEASELYGCGSRNVPTLLPYFTDVEDIMAYCPPTRKDILSKYLASKAFRHAVTLCKLGEKGKASELFDRFFSNGHYPKQAVQLRLLIELAPLLPFIRRLWHMLH